MDETYQLDWKTFPNHLVSTFKDLGGIKEFADVTLVSDDQIQTPAHKVVLSACSPVLRSLLVNNPHSHPLLYLRGIKQIELQAILKFMYFGETQISEDRIDEFLTVARDLEFKEISNKQDENGTPEKNILSPQLEEKVEEAISEKGEIYPESIEINEKEEKIEAYQDIDFDGILTNALERKTTIRRITRSGSGKRFKCDKCEATYGKGRSLRTHKQVKHEGKTFDCEICGIGYSDPSSLRQHRRKVHEKNLSF